MFRTITKDVVCPASGQKLETFVTGQAGIRQVVKEVWAEVVAEAILVGYLDQDKVLEAGLDTEQATYLPIPVDLPVEVGKTFNAGIADNAAGGMTAMVTVVVEETPI